MSTTPQYLTAEYTETNAAILKRRMDLDENPTESDYPIVYAIWDKLVEFSAGIPKHKLVEAFSDVFGKTHMQFLLDKSKETGKQYLPLYLSSHSGDDVLFLEEVIKEAKKEQPNYQKQVVIFVPLGNLFVEVTTESDPALLVKYLKRKT